MLRTLLLVQTPKLPATSSMARSRTCPSLEQKGNSCTGGPASFTAPSAVSVGVSFTNCVHCGRLLEGQAEASFRYLACSRCGHLDTTVTGLYFNFKYMTCMYTFHY